MRLKFATDGQLITSHERHPSNIEVFLSFEMLIYNKYRGFRIKKKAKNLLLKKNEINLYAIRDFRLTLKLY